MAKKKVTHIHRYERMNNGTSFKCVIPECIHIMHGGIELLIGRKAECPYCNTTFIIHREHLRRKEVHCMICTKNGKPIESPKIEIEENPQLDDELANLLKSKGIQ